MKKILRKFLTQKKMLTSSKIFRLYIFQKRQLLKNFILIQLLKNLIIKLRSFRDWGAIELYKRIPTEILKLQEDEFLDYFLSGKFHFEIDHSHIPSELLPRIYLTKNEWQLYFDSTKQEDSFSTTLKDKEISECITIAFFCSYSSSHFFEKTILSYAKINSKIRWILCKFIDFPHEKHTEGIELVVFKDVNSAIDFCNSSADFIIDADGPLRPTKTLEVLKHTSAYVLNYYNLITTSNKYFYDALIIPKFVTAAPFISEKKIIELDVLGGWNLPPLLLKNNHSPKKYHFAIIAEQFKISFEFLNNFSILSHNFKFIFVGIKYPYFLIDKMRMYGWNLNNIYFKRHIPLLQLRSFLKENVYSILDIPNYSSGSGTIVGLSVGIPTICKDGSYWINQMASSIMTQTKNSSYIYNQPTQIENIVKEHLQNSAELEVRIEESARKSGYLNPEIFLNDLHQELLKSFPSQQSRPSVN